MNGPIGTRTTIVTSVLLTLLVGLGLASVIDWPSGTEAAPAVQLSDRAVQQLEHASNLSDAFIAIADAVTPAVVRIEAERSSGGQRADSAPPSLRDLFGPDGQRPQQPLVSGGSGLIVSSDGYVLTNNHVVANADRIWVTLLDRRTYEAEVVGRDPTTDIAVIRIEADGLPTVELGDSEAARVGEWVLAIGNPGFSDASTLDFTVTSGIISAKGRPLSIIQDELAMERNPAASYAIEDFIQTDAVINPGNSGGPLVNLNGEVVGLNTAIASGTGFYQGYGFAIPMNLARWVMDDLIEHGHVRRALLGIMIRNVTPEDAEVYDLPEISGVLVEDFSPDSPARRAGLDRSDVIVAIDGQPVDRVGQLQRVIAQHRDGERVTVRVIRYGDAREYDVRLTEAAIEQPNRPARSNDAPLGEQGLGLEIRELTGQLAREHGYNDAGGALVVNVEPMSPAHRKGVQGGERIVAIDRDSIGSAEQAEAMLERLRPGQVVSLLLQNRDGRTRIANIRVR